MTEAKRNPNWVNVASHSTSLYHITNTQRKNMNIYIAIPFFLATREPNKRRKNKYKRQTPTKTNSTFPLYSQYDQTINLSTRRATSCLETNKIREWQKE